MSAKQRRTPKQRDASRESGPVGEQPAQLLVDNPSRWRSWWVRVNLSVAMILGFGVIIYLGHFGLVALVLGLQIAGFRELMNVRDTTDQSPSDAAVRFSTTIVDYLIFGSTQYLVYGLILQNTLLRLAENSAVLEVLTRYHLAISGALYSATIVYFVLSLQKNHYQTQYKNVTWAVMATVGIFPSSLHIANIFNGIAWFLLPVLLIITNDCTAYIWGFFFGRTSLIQLSPKKTWEGFLGALVSTVILAFVYAALISKFSYFTCAADQLLEGACIPGPAFKETAYEMPTVINELTGTFGFYLGTLKARPFQIYALTFGLFASLIAPFGGFIASGFKRAHGIKDFGTLIPGHGGIVDRMDCQVIMAAFSFVMHALCTSEPVVDAAFASVLALHPYQQLTLYQQLEVSLLQRRML